MPTTLSSKEDIYLVTYRCDAELWSAQNSAHVERRIVQRYKRVYMLALRWNKAVIFIHSSRASKLERKR
jgi:hypothetical protein